MRHVWKTTTERGIPGGWYRALMRRRRAADSRRFDSLCAWFEASEAGTIDTFAVREELRMVRVKWLSANGKDLLDC